MIPCYIAHRLGTDIPRRELNRRDAMRWVCWLSERYLIEPVCPWIVLAEGWAEEARALGLEIDRAAVERVGLLIACGPVVSPGMRAEMGWARTVIDATPLQCADPSCLREPELAWLDAKMSAAGIEGR